MIDITNGSKKGSIDEAQRLMGLKVHHDGLKPYNFLVWQSVEAFVR